MRAGALQRHATVRGRVRDARRSEGLWRDLAALHSVQPPGIIDGAHDGPDKLTENDSNTLLESDAHVFPHTSFAWMVNEDGSPTCAKTNPMPDVAHDGACGYLPPETCFVVVKTSLLLSFNGMTSAGTLPDSDANGSAGTL